MATTPFTTEKENFMRLVLLVNDQGSEAFQQCLLHFSTFQHKVVSFDDVLHIPAVKTNLKMLKGKPITAQQWGQLYPGAGIHVDTRQLDITLCFVLLKCARICALYPPLTTWDKPPAKDDTSVEGALAQIKHIRNLLSHSQKPELSDADFTQIFDQTINAILNIEKDVPSWSVTRTDLLAYKTRAISPDIEADLEDAMREWAQQDADLKADLKEVRSTIEQLEIRQTDIIEKLDTMHKDFQNGDKKSTEKQRNIAKLVQDFVADLKDFYNIDMSEIQVLDEDDRVPMDDIHVAVSWSLVKNPTARKEKKMVENYLEIFDIPRIIDKKLARRILVEGTVGMGKSVFSQKVCVDWARGIEILSRFAILLHISLAEVEEDATLQEVIFSQIQVDIDDDTKNDVMSYIQENQSKTLLVLDGYDEYSDKNQHINKILSRSILRDCCVIITSRPWKTADEKSLKHYDLFLELEGFKQEASIREFTAKFMKLKSEDENEEALTARFMAQLKKQNLLSFVQAPFLLVISCLLFLETRYHIPSRVTEMYQQLMDLMFDRCEERKKIQITKRHEILLALGKLSYEILISDQRLLFQKGSIGEKYGNVVFDAGFLTQHKIRSCRSRYIATFPHISFAEYLAAYYLIHVTGELDTFIKMHLNVIRFTARYENVLKFTCGLSETHCPSVLQHLINIIGFCQDSEESFAIDLCSVEQEQFEIKSYRDYSGFFSFLLLQCANEGNHTWKKNRLTVNFLLVNEDTYRLIPLNVELWVQTILCSGLESSRIESIYRRLDAVLLERMVFEKQTNLNELHSLFQEHRVRMNTIEIRQSQISSFQDIQYLKYHPTLNRLFIDDLKLTQNNMTQNDLTLNDLAQNDLTQNDLSQNDLTKNDLTQNDLIQNEGKTNIEELVITRSSSSVTKYFLEDQQILKKLMKITTSGEDMMKLLAVKTLKKIKVIEVDNQYIEEPENQVNLKEFGKLINFHRTIEEMTFKRCHVLMSSQAASENMCSQDEIGDAQIKKPQKSITKMMMKPSVTNIKFDECSFVDEMGQGFQQLEFFEKLLDLNFQLCNIAMPLLSLLGRTLSKLKYLGILYITCKKEMNNTLQWLAATIDRNSYWKNMAIFSVADGVTSKEDMTAVISMVKQMPNLSVLGLQNLDAISSLEQDTIEPLLNKGIPCVNVTTLDLTGLKLTGRMKDVLHTIKPLKTLEKLYLHNNGFDDRDASILLHFIENSFQKTIVLPNLKKISIRGNLVSFQMKNQLNETGKTKSLVVQV